MTQLSVDQTQQLTLILSCVKTALARKEEKSYLPPPQVYAAAGTDVIRLLNEGVNSEVIQELSTLISGGVELDEVKPVVYYEGGVFKAALPDKDDNLVDQTLLSLGKGDHLRLAAILASIRDRLYATEAMRLVDMKEDFQWANRVGLFKEDADLIGVAVIAMSVRMAFEVGMTAEDIAKQAGFFLEETFVEVPTGRVDLNVETPDEAQGVEGVLAEGFFGEGAGQLVSSTGASAGTDASSGDTEKEKPKNRGRPKKTEKE